ncbi:[NiFe]-hydrogenase assembly chaperone HybE [Variovorax sp. OV700]|jgi:[NiFe] hydrogenase assembly HybE family chaperone|uniref:[NiFe]-hydrogenase assembly chaperone HybE n=1 Tax=Variovorax sp. OV700 TaxID=1882826 RepID=UPI00088CC3A1|nr:[NiFe]-hydrogenase assembly chaperone HybE [Variovorax sp. OV700]SDH81826.1 [NiFe] hydrogenase assembly chaperone, HybE family [Variovorax sp. OV700]
MTLTHGAGHAELTLRTRALEALFDGIARSRMAGLPFMNSALRVEAVDFALEPSRGSDELQDTAESGHAAGVLVTPWFMNLVRFPLVRRDTPAQVGTSRLRKVGQEQFAFTGAHEDAFGTFEACSLFSPVFEFAAQADAIATASALLAQLHQRVVARAEPGAPARRSFLLGRGGMQRQTP